MALVLSPKMSPLGFNLMQVQGVLGGLHTVTVSPRKAETLLAHHWLCSGAVEMLWQVQQHAPVHRYHENCDGGVILRCAGLLSIVAIVAPKVLNKTKYRKDWQHFVFHMYD